MKQKLIFLDIDGTILVWNKGISKTVREGLKKARSLGHKVFICTGRSWCTLPKELEDIELDGIVASAGSDIWIDGENKYRISLEPSLIRNTCAFLDDMGAIYVLEGFDRVYVSKRGARVLAGSEPVSEDNPELARWKEFFRKRNDVGSIEEWEKEETRIPKITFAVWSEEEAEKVKKVLEDSFYVAFFLPSSGVYYNGELISKTANKGSAIHQTAAYLQSSMADTIAFGDSMNDYQMIEEAGVGVVMENGDQKLKEIADRVCESVEEDGVIWELVRMGVIPMDTYGK